MSGHGFYGSTPRKVGERTARPARIARNLAIFAALTLLILVVAL